MQEGDFFVMRDRAHTLAATGRYKEWAKVASKLRSEGFAATLVQRLDSDKLAVMMLTRCCIQARGAR